MIYYNRSKGEGKHERAERKARCGSEKPSNNWSAFRLPCNKNNLKAIPNKREAVAFTKYNEKE